MRLIGFYNYTVILTYMSLGSSLLGMILSGKNNFTAAAFCLALSGICDMFDGIVARTKKDRSDMEKGFGIQLDSLCDVVCFGVFPAFMLYKFGTDNVIGMIILLLYVLCAVIRLAYFNVLESKRQQTESGCAKEYRGLPVTTAAIVFPLYFWFFDILPMDMSYALQFLLPLVMAFLFVLDFSVPKIDFVKLLKRK